MTLALLAFMRAVVSLRLQDQQQGWKAIQGPQHIGQASSNHLHGPAQLRCPRRCAALLSLYSLRLRKLVAVRTAAELVGNSRVQRRERRYRSHLCTDLRSCTVGGSALRR